MENKQHLKNYLLEILNDLELIEEPSIHHPEENVLVHSLQVFELACQSTNDPELWAAALLHDVGKANAGNDTLDGGAGNDALRGGAGNEIYIVDSTSDIVTENLNEGTDTVRSSITITTLANNVENLVLIVAAANGVGNALNNTITGNSLANTLSGGTGVDTLIGGLGNDTYVIDTTTDTITSSWMEAPTTQSKPASTST